MAKGLANPNPVFVDSDSLAALGWKDLWAAFVPLTVYGQQVKASATPFLPGQEDELQAIWSQLEQDLADWSADDARRLHEDLQNWPNVLDALALLTRPQGSLSPKHLLSLKQFAYRGFHLARAEGFPGTFTWTDTGRWQGLLTTLGQGDSPSFAVVHVAGADFSEHVRAHAEALRQLGAVTRDRDAKWQERLRQRPHRDGQVVLSLPEQADLAAALKQDPGARWLRDTPFESVFELLPSAQMEQAAVTVALCQEELTRAADVALSALTQQLLRDLGRWEQAVADITALDLRLARRQLAEAWGGSVPRLGNGLHLLEGAVHPLVAQRLRQQGRSYVPLDFGPQAGANALFGSNMGGKTVAMSLLAVCQLCAQFGLPVPAESFQTRLFPVVRFCASAETDLSSGLSSFGSEVTRLAQAWQDVKQSQFGLLCLDEPARSTNPIEGEALVVGLVRAAAELGRDSVLLLATHFSAVLYEPAVIKFRVRGLQPGWRQAQANGSASAQPAPEVVREAGNAIAKVKETLATAADPVRAYATPGNAIEALAQWMDYRVERVEGAGEFLTEALPVAKWLGLPPAVLRESEQFLQRRRES